MANYGKTLTFEVATEVGQRAVTILAGEMGKWVDGNGATMRGQGEWSEELWQEAVGALQTFAVGLTAGPVTGLARDVGRARRAQAYQGLFDAIAEGVSDSPSVKRAPESVQEFIKTATKDGPVEHVYIDEDKFSKYSQSKNMDPATVAAELTGNTNALAEARTTGEAIAIPTAVYGTRVAANHHVGLAGDLRIGPQGPMEMTPKEATALREALVASQKAQAEREQAAAEGQPAGPPTPRQTLGKLFARSASATSGLRPTRTTSATSSKPWRSAPRSIRRPCSSASACAWNGRATPRRPNSRNQGQVRHHRQEPRQPAPLPRQAALCPTACSRPSPTWRKPRAGSCPSAGSRRRSKRHSRPPAWCVRRRPATARPIVASTRPRCGRCARRARPRARRGNRNSRRKGKRCSPAAERNGRDKSPDAAAAAAEPATEPAAQPKLLQGQSYQVVLRNLWRLLTRATAWSRPGRSC